MAALRHAAQLGFAYIDIELKAAEAFFAAAGASEAVRQGGTRVIVSSHNYDKTPPTEELLALVDRWVGGWGGDGVSVSVFVGGWVIRVEQAPAVLSWRARLESLLTLLCACQAAGAAARLLARPARPMALTRVALPPTPVQLHRGRGGRGQVCVHGHRHH